MSGNPSVYPSRMEDKFIVRMPDGMREQLARLAKLNGRSMNQEIVLLLKGALGNAPAENLNASECPGWVGELIAAVKDVRAEVAGLRTDLNGLPMSKLESVLSTRDIALAAFLIHKMKEKIEVTPEMRQTMFDAAGEFQETEAGRRFFKSSLGAGK